jgi:hypothetical protein
VSRVRLAAAAAAAVLAVAGASGCADTARPRTPHGSESGTTVSAVAIADGFADPEMFCHEGVRAFAREWGPHGADWPSAEVVYRELQKRC